MLNLACNENKKKQSMDNIFKEDLRILVENGWLDEDQFEKYIQDEEIIYAIESSTSPSKENIFNALKTLPVQKVKVVILGKDPYPNPLHAHGFAFSSLNDTTPDSLKNIFKAIDAAYNSKLFEKAENNLTNWVSQGVLLLNTSLTFEKAEDKQKQARLQNLHAKIWKKFTRNIIEKILSSKNRIVLFLWGNDAHDLVYKSIKNNDFQKTIHNRAPQFVPGTNTILLMASHPSPLSVNRGGDFLDIVPKHFLECDKFLAGNKIDWISL